MSDLTPETALAMATVYAQVRATEPEDGDVEAAWAEDAETRFHDLRDARLAIEALSLLGFEVRRKEEVPKFRKPTAKEKAFALDRWRLERLESDIAADDREDAAEQRKGGAT